MIRASLGRKEPKILMMAGASIRRALRAAFFVSSFSIVLLWAQGSAWAAVAHETPGGLREWIASFNVGSGALIVNPVIILIQWANFIIILLVLNKILYKPLWQHINERNGQIEGDLSSAERDRSETLGYITQYEDSLAEIQRENGEAMAALQQEITEAGRKQIEEVREKTAREMEEARATISGEASQAASELKGRAEEFAAQIANRLAGRQIA